MKKLNEKNTYVIISFLIGGIVATILFYFLNKDFIETGKKYCIINECKEKIIQSGWSDFDEEKAFEGAINGYLKSGVDKYTAYLPDDNADPIEEMKDYVNTSGTAIASGFQIDCDSKGNIILIEVKEGMTADMQGLKTGDVITEINGVNVSETGFPNIANRLMGKQDTIVNLTIFRNNEILNIDFKRDNQIISDVEYENIDNIGYIKIKGFNQFMQGRFNTAIVEFENCSDLILDLRDNPGGDGDTVMNLASQVVGNVEVMKYYYTGESESEILNNEAIDKKNKIILLVNQNTASAAEIFTALLKQYGENVTIIGETTFGKGIFQEEQKLSNGGILHYTAGYYTVGDWECYHGIGIKPDIEILMDNSLIGTDNDIQLKKAVDILSDAEN